MKPFAILIALLTIVLTTACGGAASDGSSGSSGGVLTIFGSDPPTLDPAVMGDTSSAEYVVEIFSGLATLNQQLQIVPDIAESWTISQDGKTYTFKIRNGVTFHDGKSVTANDFKFSLERAADPKTQSPVADTYLGDISGVREKLAGNASTITGVNALDDSTLELKLDEARFYFLAKMTYPTSFVVDKENVESGKSWMDTPNGTGPFKLKEWSKGTRIVLERNPDFYDDPAKLDEVNFLLAGGSGMTMYENDEVDITGVGLSDIDRIKDPSNPLNKEFVVAPQLSIWYVGFNSKIPPFDDVKVRQAFTHAVNKDQIIEVILKNLVERGDGVLPPGMPGFNPNLRGLNYDAEKAKQLLAESKYGGNLPEITFTIPSSSTTVDPITEAIIEMWRVNLGVEVKIQQVEWAQFLGDIKRNPAAGKENKFQLFELGWSADYPDPQDFIDILFYSKSLDNNGAYANAQVDNLIDQARVESNLEQRFKLYQEAEQLIVDDAGWLPLYHGKSYQLVKSRVKGYVPPPMIIPIYRFIYIDESS